MSLENEGLSLFQAAKLAGVEFTRSVTPKNKTIELNGLKFHYLDWGNENKAPVLLLHGALQQSHSWDFVSLSLCQDYHVIALDARGHGDSDWDPNHDYSLDAHQKDLDAFVETLGLEQFILIGHSMGGRNAFVFASRHRVGIRGLIIVDTGPKTDPRGTNRIRQFRELPDKLATYQEFAERVHQYTGRPLKHVLGALKYVIRQLPDGKWTWKYDSAMRNPNYRVITWPETKLWEALGKIYIPTLIIRGEESDVFENETLNLMLASMPNATSTVIPKAGHLVPGDNPPAFINAVKTFLAEL